MKKDLALKIFKEVPLNANCMRMNAGHAMFYKTLLIDGEINIWRYLRYKNSYVPLLSIHHSFDDFERINGLFCVDQFRLGVYQLYTRHAYSKDQLQQILNNAPSGTHAYDPINGDYWRMGTDNDLYRWNVASTGIYTWEKVEIEYKYLADFTLNICTMNSCFKTAI